MKGIQIKLRIDEVTFSSKIIPEIDSEIDSQSLVLPTQIHEVHIVYMLPTSLGEFIVL